jgi:hypothetical protein
MLLSSLGAIDTRKEGRVEEGGRSGTWSVSVRYWDTLLLPRPIVRWIGNKKSCSVRQNMSRDIFFICCESEREEEREK